jgi:hypothetical protein
MEPQPALDNQTNDQMVNANDQPMPNNLNNQMAQTNDQMAANSSSSLALSFREWAEDRLSRNPNVKVDYNGRDCNVHGVTVDGRLMIQTQTAGSVEYIPLNAHLFDSLVRQLSNV